METKTQKYLNSKKFKGLSHSFIRSYLEHMRNSGKASSQEIEQLNMLNELNLYLYYARPMCGCMLFSICNFFVLIIMLIYVRMCSADHLLVNDVTNVQARGCLQTTNDVSA